VLSRSSSLLPLPLLGGACGGDSAEEGTSTPATTTAVATGSAEKLWASGDVRQPALSSCKRFRRPEWTSSLTGSSPNTPRTSVGVAVSALSAPSVSPQPTARSLLSDPHSADFTTKGGFRAATSTRLCVHGCCGRHGGVACQRAEPLVRRTVRVGVGAGGWCSVRRRHQLWGPACEPAELRCGRRRALCA